MDSDPDIEIVDKIDKDSGMASKDETPERKSDLSSPKEEVKEAENYDDEPDETLGERLWGLTEMFPETVRNATSSVNNFTVSSIKGLYKFTCNASWIFFTSSMILFAPVIFETERANMEEMQKSEQKQLLLGPGAAGTGLTPGMPPI
ncbi:mitochondrial import receptor subunit TOM22 homolog [Culicoides brevitarsis]|uniref:mitochondrial import receptor subunit TOM22 homolog n=1 Tax=Culicoides brevitarsis TaxID=469753 RepID=UPI00307BE346